MVALVDNEHAAELLSQARSEAEGQLDSLRRDPGTPADDQADASASADDLVATGTDEALEELLTRRLEAIERAEARLLEGRYGLSIQSGDPIPDGRLEIEPWAELTVEEQASA
jgi:DnaK suppressor protein